MYEQLITYLYSVPAVLSHAVGPTSSQGTPFCLQGDFINASD